MISIPSNRSEGNIDEDEISIGSVVDTVNADSAKKSGLPRVAAFESITFSPANKANLLRKNKTLLTRLPINVGNELVVLSPTLRSS